MKGKLLAFSRRIPDFAKRRHFWYTSPGLATSASHTAPRSDYRRYHNAKKNVAYNTRLSAITIGMRSARMTFSAHKLIGMV